MKIAIDARVLDKGITGTGRCLENLLREIPKIDKDNKYYVFSGKNLDIDQDFYFLNISTAPFLPYKFYSPFWLNKTLPHLLTKYNIDVLFSPNILLPFIKPRKIKYITVIHDVFPFTYKQYYPKSYRYYLSLFLPKSLKKADRIITSSEFSKKEIVKTFNFPENKIEVVFTCVPYKFEQNKNKENYLPDSFINLNLSSKYLLYVGAIEKRKNILGLIKIIDRLKQNGSKLTLVIVGKPNHGFNEISSELKKREDYIKCISNVDDEFLNLLYMNAFAFIFPSFYEGFGIPPLEAMKLGIPVISSNTSSLQEVVGEGGLLHNPEDFLGFVDDIQRLEGDYHFYNSMKEKATIQAKKFNLRKETQKLVDIFNSLSISS